MNREWIDLATRPELACTSAWTEACHAWWKSSDQRLREETLSSLHLSDAELAEWQRLALDERTLIRAQAHVTATRAAAEIDTTKRTLIAGLRNGPIVANHRDGSRTEYVDAAEVSKHVASLPAMFDLLPQHPILRAAWLTQAIGAIHPFRDSNGGTSRFLSSVELSRGALPPFILTKALREGAYVPALMLANQHQMWPLLQIHYECVHQTLASTLLAGSGGYGDWQQQEIARAARWTSLVDREWTHRLGTDSTRCVADERVFARFARRRVRLPMVPTPRCFEWKAVVPLPLQLDLVIAPVRAGETAWLVAAIDASIGDGEIAAATDGEAIPVYFVAPENESDEVVDLRFAAWSAQRIEQCVRGFARWI